MLLRCNHTKPSSDSLTSAIMDRSQHPEHEQAELRARLEDERQLGFLAAQILVAVQVAPVIGGTIEEFAYAMRAPLPRGRAGGFARSNCVVLFRCPFMGECEKYNPEEHECCARGGRARAESASRVPDGTFV